MVVGFVFEDGVAAEAEAVGGQFGFCVHWCGWLLKRIRVDVEVVAEEGIEGSTAVGFAVVAKLVSSRRPP